MQMIKEIALAMLITAGALWVLIITILTLYAVIAGIQSVAEENKAKRKEGKKNGTKR